MPKNPTTLSATSVYSGPSTEVSIPVSAEDRRIATLAACAIALSVVDAALPSPLPGVKPGLANIVTLIVLHRFGLNAALWVSLLRIVAGSILIGTFLSPSFVLSLCGGLASLATLAVTMHLPKKLFGPVSHSIIAALAHVAAQLLVVYLWLIPHTGISYLIPLFGTAAVVFGTVNGLVATKLLQNRFDRPAYVV